MILNSLFKRIKKGDGFSHFSAKSWDLMCKIIENMEGVGCRVEKSRGGKFLIVVDGTSSDIPLPDDVSPYTPLAGVPVSVLGKNAAGEIGWVTVTTGFICSEIPVE